jgi:hypothetical protein
MSALASYEASDDDVGVSDSFLFQSLSGAVTRRELVMCLVRSISVGRAPVL